VIGDPREHIDPLEHVIHGFGDLIVTREPWPLRASSSR
jgi:hypothetical protein